MAILRWYEYLFYRLYQWRLKRPSPISRPRFDAVSFIFATNSLYLMGLVSIVAVFNSKVYKLIVDDPTRFKVIVAGSALIILLLHQYFYLWRNRSEEIISCFKDVKPTRLGTFGVVFYMVFGYVFCIASGLLLLPSIHAQLSVL